MRASFLLPAVVIAAGCGDERVTWRIPCGGTGQLSDETAVSETYRFEGDDSGHLTLEELTRGAMITLETARYEGDVRVVYTFDDGTVQYEETATVAGGRKAVVTRTGTLAEHRFVETWAWGDDRPSGWVRDHEYQADQEGVFGTGGGSLIENVCSRSDTGVLSECNSLRYTGPYARWMARERDDNSDGTPEGIELRTFDDHGLETSFERRYGGADGRETLVTDVRTQREADGSPIQKVTTTRAPGFERVHTLVYSYACE